MDSLSTDIIEQMIGDDTSVNMQQTGQMSDGNSKGVSSNISAVEEIVPRDELLISVMLGFIVLVIALIIMKIRR